MYDVQENYTLKNNLLVLLWWCIDDEEQRILPKDMKVIIRWKEYFKKLLKDAFSLKAIDRVEWILGIVDFIQEK